ncbi:MAG: hypothetical protein AAB552_01710 [Patescibacteria group bacterium]
MSTDGKSRIAELEKELNAKEFTPHKAADTLEPRASDVRVASSWDQPKDSTALAAEEVHIAQHHHLMKKILLGSLGFFVVAVAIAMFVSLNRSNLVSPDKIAINITAPVAISGGDSFETKITIVNNNSVRIDQADLFFEYPSGFYSASDKSDLLRVSRNIGALSSGESAEESVNTMVYGEENTEKEVRVVLEYRLAGSNATFKKFTTYVVKVTSSPVNVKLGMLKEASSGQEVELSVDVESNSIRSMENLLLDVSYPLGFTFLSASPAPSYQNNVWNIGTLAAQGKRTIKIKGIVEGQEGEEKVAKVSLGTQSSKDERVIGVVYTTTTETLALTKPFLGVDLVVNGDRSPEYVATKGEALRVDAFWVSNNTSPITDAVIEIKLKGEALNRYSVYASNGGFYQSINDTIVWEKSRNPELAVIEPGARGSVSFSFSPIPLSVDAGRILKNSQIVLELKARARRHTTGSISEEASTFASRKIKLETDIRLTARSLYYAGPFKNIGTLPPRADKETTYTIAWTVHNASNNISNVFVRTTLPIYVKWRGAVDPAGEDVVYNESGAEVVWNAGRIPSGGSREVAFQIGLTPSLSQIDTTPLLTGDSLLTAVDDFTKTNLRDKKSAVTTNLSSDPQFGQNEGGVIR